MCNQAIMLITDGAMEDFESVFEEFNWPDRRVRTSQTSVHPAITFKSKMLLTPAGLFPETFTRCKQVCLCVQVRVFTYLIGREMTFAQTTKWIACNNKGQLCVCVCARGGCSLIQCSVAPPVDVQLYCRQVCDLFPQVITHTSPHWPMCRKMSWSICTCSADPWSSTTTTTSFGQKPTWTRW